VSLRLSQMINYPLCAVNTRWSQLFRVYSSAPHLPIQIAVRAFRKIKTTAWNISLKFSCLARSARCRFTLHTLSEWEGLLHHYGQPAYFMASNGCARGNPHPPTHTAYIATHSLGTIFSSLTNQEFLAFKKKVNRHNDLHVFKLTFYLCDRRCCRKNVLCFQQRLDTSVNWTN